MGSGSDSNRHARLHHERDCVVQEVARERKESALSFSSTLKRVTR